MLILGACGQQIDDAVTSQYRDIGWENLKPEGEEEVEQPIDHNSGLESLEVVNDWYTSEKYSDIPGLSDSYYGAPPQAGSVGVVAEINNQSIRIPGFIVPVEFEAGNLVTEFFLVPYFGACFHKPPPPPNQTIYVTSSKPIKYKSIYDPVWVLGVVKTEQQGNDMATAAYSMDLHHLEDFVEY